jgi:hypothetical protein
MNRGRVGEERGGKEMDRCPLTAPMNIAFLKFPSSPILDMCLTRWSMSAVISASFQLALGALQVVAGRVVDIDSEKCVMSPIKVAFKRC